MVENCRIDDCQKRLLVAYLEGMIARVKSSWERADLAPDSDLEAVADAENYLACIKRSEDRSRD